MFVLKWIYRINNNNAHEYVCWVCPAFRDNMRCTTRLVRLKAKSTVTLFRIKYSCIDAYFCFFFYSVRAANILSTTVLELDISCTRSHTTTLPPPTSTPNGEQITLEIDKQHSDIDFFFVIFVVIFLGLDPKYLTTVIPYHIENGTPDNPALQVLIKSKWNSIDYCRNVCLHYNKIVTI